MSLRPVTRSASDSHLRALFFTLLAAAPAALLAVEPLACAPSAFTADDGDASTDGGVIPIVVTTPDAPSSDGADAGDSSACTPIGTGALAVLGCPCSAPGTAACAGNAQDQGLLCTSGVWTASARCPAGQLCDTRPGSTQGTCLPEIPSCVGAEAGQAFCADPLTVRQCGVDGVSASVLSTCSQQTCIDAGCTGVCGPVDTMGTSSRQCAGGTLQQCTEAGAWVDLQMCGLCCESSCIDPSSGDPKVARNCGRCGHDCQQGGCLAGVCQPATLGSVGDAGVLSGPLAVDDRNVYATTSTGVVAAPLSGARQTLQPLVSGRSGGNPFGIAVAAGNVYWTEPQNGLVMGVGAGLEGGAPFTVASGQIQPDSLAADDKALYWTVADNASGGGVVAMPLSGVLDGGAPATLFSGTFPVIALAVDPSGLYFAQAGCHQSNGASVCTQAISRLPPGATGDAGPPMFLANDRTATALAVQGPDVYWTSLDKCGVTDAGLACPGFVERVGMEGGAPVTLASQLNLGGPLVADDSGLYLAGQVAVLGLPFDGGAATPLAEGISPGGIAQSATMLYWTDPTAGQIGKVTKP